MTPKKDLPFKEQETELNMRKKGKKLMKVDIEIEGEDEEETKEEDRKLEAETGKDNGRMVKQIEGVLFVPATPESGLRKLLQEAKDKAAIMMNTPSIRIVERSGTKLMEEIGDTDPWRNEWCCQRKSCLPCQGQSIL